MEDKEKYLVLIDSREFQQRVMDCITSEEIDKFFQSTVFADDERCKQAMIHGIERKQYGEDKKNQRVS